LSQLLLVHHILGLSHTLLLLLRLHLVVAGSGSMSFISLTPKMDGTVILDPIHG